MSRPAALTVTAAVLGSIAWLASQSTPPPPPYPIHRVATIAAVTTEPRHWYAGGTLHDASASAWLAATKRDRIATATDWIVSWQMGEFNRVSIVAGFRFHALAKQVETCVTAAAYPQAPPAGQIATICAVLLWGGAPAP